MQCDSVGIGREPCATGRVEPVAGAVVDDQENLATPVATHQQPEKLVEGAAVEAWGKLIREACVVQRDGAKDMGGLALAVGIYARLDTDPTPGLVERAIEPETGLVFEEDDATTSCGFFLIAGNVVRSQNACRSRSARASRLRGRCTEKPS